MGRVLALDVGERRIGVALSDSSGILASPLTIIEQDNQEQAITDILKIVKERIAGTIVIGLPYSLNGNIGPQAAKVQSFVMALQSQTDIPIIMRDERYTTVAAESLKKETAKKKSAKKIRYDAMAAAIILQEYLDEQPKSI